MTRRIRRRLAMRLTRPLPLALLAMFGKDQNT